MIKVNSYEDCFKAYPDTKVLEAKYYGSYQGEFLCKIIHKGEAFYIHDWYGSCSGCDSFQAEFGFQWDGSPEDKVIQFAKPYIESALPRDKMLAFLKKEIADDPWGGEKKEMLADMENGF